MSINFGEAMEGQNIMEAVNKAIEVIVRPPRAEYDINDDVTAIPVPGHPAVEPFPFEIINRKGLKIVGTLYPSVTFAEEEEHKCVIYLHGNIGSQLEGRHIVPLLAPQGISVFCFDCTGSGNSEGQYITLGMSEAEDTVDVMNFLANDMDCSGFVLWGRSMGAATAAIANRRHKRVRGVICDSGYTSVHDVLSNLATRLIDEAGIQIPINVLPMAVWGVKNRVKALSGLDCDDVTPIEDAKSATVPLLLGHSPQDKVVGYELGKNLYESWATPDKTMYNFSGDHNDPRCDEWYTMCVDFIGRCFTVAVDTQNLDTTAAAEQAPQHAASVQELMEKNGQ